MDRSDLERIKSASDIVTVVMEHVHLVRKGKRLWGLCPFHSEKTPSFCVDPERQTYKCFGCGKGGDVITFLMDRKGVSFSEAAQELAGRAGIEPARTSSARSQNKALYEANAIAMAYFERMLASAAGEPARRYLEARGITRRIVEDFHIGYAGDSWEGLVTHLASRGVSLETAAVCGLVVPGRGGRYRDRFRNRVMFPIVDLSGEVVGFGGRVLGEGEPKYLNTAETPIFEKRKVLYNLHAARGLIRQRGAVIVEGYMDVVSLAEAGFTGAVATLGTALGHDHVRLLRRFTEDVTLVFDGDAAGRKAMLRAVEPFAELGMVPKVVLLPEGKDPDDMARQDMEGFRFMLEEARDIFEFVFDESFSRHDPSKLRGQNAILRELTSMLSLLGDPALRELLANRLAARLGVSTQVVLGRVAPFRGAPQPAQPGGNDTPAERGMLETTFARLIVCDGGAAESLRRMGLKLEFANKDIQAMYDCVIRHGHAFLDDASCPDAVREAASRIRAMGEFPGDTKKALIDTVYRFKSLAIDEELRRIQGEICDAERTKDRQRLHGLLRAKQNAMLARKGLRARIMEEIEGR